MNKTCAVAWKVGCMFSATVLETLSGLLALILFVMLFPDAAGRLHQWLFQLLLWLPIASAFLGIPLGSYFAERQQAIAGCGRWLFPLLAIPPGVFSIFAFREGGEELWRVILSDWLIAYFFLSAPVTAGSLLLCALMLLLGGGTDNSEAEEERIA